MEWKDVFPVRERKYTKTFCLTSYLVYFFSNLSGFYAAAAALTAVAGGVMFSRFSICPSHSREFNITIRRYSD